MCDPAPGSFKTPPDLLLFHYRLLRITPMENEVGGGAGLIAPKRGWEVGWPTPVNLLSWLAFKMLYSQEYASSSKASLMPLEKLTHKERRKAKHNGSVPKWREVPPAWMADGGSVSNWVSTCTLHRVSVVPMPPGHRKELSRDWKTLPATHPHSHPLLSLTTPPLAPAC